MLLLGNVNHQVMTSLDLYKMITEQTGHFPYKISAFYETCSSQLCLRFFFFNDRMSIINGLSENTYAVKVPFQSRLGRFN